MYSYFFIGSIWLFLLSSCSGFNIKDEKLSYSDSLEREHFIDSFKNAKEEEFKKDIVNDMLDTTGLYLAPIKIISAVLISREYSNYKDIQLTFKNISNKKISAIRFKWYGLNAFGEPAEMGSNSLVEGFGGGFTDMSILPGKINTSQWDIMSKDGKKVVLAWPYEVAFEDGTKWELKK